MDRASKWFLLSTIRTKQQQSSGAVCDFVFQLRVRQKKFKSSPIRVAVADRSQGCDGGIGELELNPHHFPRNQGPAQDGRRAALAEVQR
jgi:hypothetical protein